MYLLETSEYSGFYLIATATVGNMMGSMITYCMGLGLMNLIGRRDGAVRIVDGIGYFSLFFSWAPVIGDAICFAAGVARLNVWISAAIIFVSKLTRYLLVAQVISLVL